MKEKTELEILSEIDPYEIADGNDEYWKRDLIDHEVEATFLGRRWYAFALSGNPIISLGLGIQLAWKSGIIVIDLPWLMLEFGYHVAERFNQTKREQIAR